MRKIYYSGGDGKRNRMGVVLDKDMKQCKTDVKRIIDRVDIGENGNARFSFEREQCICTAE